MIFVGKEYFVDFLWIQFVWFIQFVVKYCFFEEVYFFWMMVVYILFVFLINVSDDFWVVMYDFKQVGGNIVIEVMGKDLLIIVIVNVGVVRGDYV